MTIPVSVAQLPGVLGRFGHAYLLTLRPNGSVKVHTVDPAFKEGRLVVACEHRSALENARREPRVTLVWPPTVHHSHSLIVDGRATVSGEQLAVEIDSAMLHRPASHADGPDWAFPTGSDRQP